MKKYYVYTDGACFPNPGSGSCAWVLLKDETENNDSIIMQDSYQFEYTTSVRMEQEAFIKAAITVNVLKENNQLEKDAIIHFKTDSMLLVNIWNKWIDGWVNKSFKDKKNKDQLILIAAIKHSSNNCFKVTHVKAHCGIHWNEYVDSLAHDARDKQFDNLR